MTLIDLGEPSWSDDPGDWSRPRRRRPELRNAALLVLTALCLLGVTGSARPEPRGVRVLWSAPADQANGTKITADSAFLQRTDVHGTKLTAYDLASGHPRWSRELPGSIGFLQVAAPAGVLFAPSDRPVADQPESAAELRRETVALDTHTGAELWRMAGEPITYTPDTALLAEFTDSGPISRVTVIGLRDGRPVWTMAVRDIDAFALARTGDQPTHVVTAGRTGEVKVYRYADGRLVAHAKLPWMRSRPDEGYFNDVQAVGDRLIVNRITPDKFDLTAYRLDTLEPVWGRGGSGAQASPCGTMLCMSGAQGLSTMDIRDGRGGWNLPAAANVWPVTADRLVLDDGLDSGRPMLVDAATGRKIGERGAGATVWDENPRDTLMLLHPTVDPPDRTSVTRWDLHSGRQDVLGTIDRIIDYQCWTTTGYLGCLRGGRFEVMAVR